jgi:glycosyltransferase involved in cell wall biosynthesis
MRIAILAHNLRVAGGYVIGINFIKSLKAAASGHQFLIFVPAGAGYEDIELPNSSRIVVYDKGKTVIPRMKFDLFELPKLIKGFEPHVILGLGNLGLTVSNCKQAILVHKPHLFYPSKHYRREAYLARFNNWLIKARIKKCLRYTDLIFCQTPVMQNRFSRVFNYPLNKIKIMPMGVSELIKAESGNTVTPEFFKQGNYFNLLFLSKFYAHKNFEILIDLFNKHRSRLSDVRVIVTISPDQHSNAPRFLKNIERYNLQKHIVNVGPLKQSEVANYYCSSDAFFLPTLLETFGLPYIEAMHFGLPILTSDLDFARFVCGESAEYFDPWNTDDILKKIMDLKNNPGLRETLISKGKLQFRRFSKSWSEITADVVHEMENLVEQPHLEKTR